MSKDLDGLFWYSLTAQIYWRILVSKAISISKQNIYIVCCRNPNYTPPPLKNGGDVVLSRVFLSTEFAHGPFHALEALRSLVNKRRQNGIFFFFNLAFFLTRIWCPDMPAMSSAARAEASEAECQHMDSSSTNLVHNSVIKPENRTGHLTHQCYFEQRLLPGIADCYSLEFTAVVTGSVGKSQKYFFTIRSWWDPWHVKLLLKILYLNLVLFFFFFSLFCTQENLSCSLISWIQAYS